METPVSMVEQLFDKTEAYLKTTFELSKVKVMDKIVTGITGVVSLLIKLVIMFFFTFFITVGTALWLGDLLGKAYYGFFIVAILYLFIGLGLSLFMYLWSKNFTNKLTSSIMTIPNTLDELENIQSDDKKALKEQLHITFISLNPFNVIKNIFKDILTLDTLKNTLLKISVVIIIKQLSKIINNNTTQSPLKKLLGSVLLFSVTNHSLETIKTLEHNIIRIIKDQIIDNNPK